MADSAAHLVDEVLPKRPSCRIADLTFVMLNEYLGQVRNIESGFVSFRALVRISKSKCL